MEHIKERRAGVKWSDEKWSISVKRRAVGVYILLIYILIEFV